MSSCDGSRRTTGPTGAISPHKKVYPVCVTYQKGAGDTEALVMDGNMKATYRLATLADADRLFEIRRESITALSTRKMSTAEAEAWAATLSLRGMEKKLRELEVWVAEVSDVIVGWGAIRGDRLEGLYMDPAFAGRGIGTELLGLLEALMRERGIQNVRAEASSNAEEFYLRRGYELTGLHTAEGAQVVRKLL
jgi:putative acetyltransferase